MDELQPIQGMNGFFVLSQHFAGHGSQKPDPSGLERDGMNETLCPTDFEQAGQIVDDELNARLINPVPHGVSLYVYHQSTVIRDSIHIPQYTFERVWC